MVPKKIVCLGDSITESKSVGVLDGWPVRLQLHLTSIGPWHIYNRGISGQTTRDALERLEKDVLSLLPGWVLIEFGINDSSFRPSQKIPRVSREDFALCLNEIVRQIQVARGEPILMINHPLGTPDPRQPNGKSRGANLRDYHEMTRRIAKKRGYPIVDLHRRLTKQGLSKWRAKGLRKDGVHLTALGHRMYAEAMMQELTPILKRKTPR